MTTLGEMRERGEGIILYCQGNAGTRWCNHSHVPSIDQLIQYFGVDYDLVANRARLLSRFVCEKCGGRLATLQLCQQQGEKPSHGLSDTAHGAGQPYVTIEESTRRYHEMAAEHRRLGIKSIAELNAESRAKLVAAKKAEKAGANFIGPPNPWAHRKNGRWL